MVSLSPRWLIALTALMGVVIAATADALVVTDEEELAGLIDSLAEVGTNGAAMDDVLSFVDSERLPLTLIADGRQTRFEGDDAKLADVLSDHFAELGVQRELIQQSVALDGERARGTLRLRGSSERFSASLRLRKDGGRWRIERLVLR